MSRQGDSAAAVHPQAVFPPCLYSCALYISTRSGIKPSPLPVQVSEKLGFGILYVANARRYVKTDERLVSSSPSSCQITVSIDMDKKFPMLIRCSLSIIERITSTRWVNENSQSKGNPRAQTPPSTCFIDSPHFRLKPSAGSPRPWPCCHRGPLSRHRLASC